MALFGAAAAVYGQIPPRIEPMDLPDSRVGPPATIEVQESSSAPPDWRPPDAIWVRGFRFTGLREFEEAKLVQVVAPSLGRSLSGEQLAGVAASVAKRIRAAGFLVAHALVPEQEVRDGIVEIAVLEGRIGKVSIEMADDARLKQAVVDRFLAAIRPGAAIRRENLEQQLLLLNDLPGVRLQATLSMRETPGEADLRVRVLSDGAPITGLLRLDNAGLRAAGEARADASIRLRSPLGIGDLLTARHLRSSGGGQVLSSVTYGLPVNGLGTRIGLRIAEQEYRLRKEFTLLDATGDQRSLGLLASHPLVRRIDSNVSLTASYSHNHYVDRLGAFSLISDVRHGIAALGISFDSRDKWMGGGANVVQLQQLWGHARQKSAFFAGLDTGPGGLNAFGGFSLVRFRVQREQMLRESTSLFASFNGQLASRNLDAGLELAVGGPEGVRAYPVGELFADQGYIARIELRERVAHGEKSATTLVAFLDQARVAVNRNAIAGDMANRRGLGAYGLGIAHAARPNVRLQAWLAWRIGEPAATAPDRKPRVWFTAAFGF